jgi:Tol biopolymer transport system component
MSDRRGDFEIFVMRPDGSDRTRLTRDPGADASPVWSSDGTMIAFVSDRTDGDYEIWVMNADGSDPRRLTFSPLLDINPVWSP